VEPIVTGGSSAATGGGAAAPGSSGVTGSGGAGAAGASATSSATSSSSSATTSSSGGGSGGAPGVVGLDGGVGPDGGTLGALDFAILGNTRPTIADDTADYPTALITQIWQDIENYAPRPAFAVTTGNYIFANPNGGQAGPQFQLYLTARAARASFSNIVFPAMGSQECTGNNLALFMSMMLAPIGETLPYYTINMSGPSNAWTAKFVFVACDTWDPTQATWLVTELSKPTTYTFVVRHEASGFTTAPCLSGAGMNNAGTIMAQYPYTLLIAGHDATFEYVAAEKEIIVGNGGAPLAGSVDYGYVVAAQQANGTIELKEMDYATNAVQTTFTVPP
jgi:hypothetical protein